MTKNRKKWKENLCQRTIRKPDTTLQERDTHAELIVFNFYQPHIFKQVLQNE